MGRRLFQDTVAELTGAPVRIFLLRKAPGSSATPVSLLPRDYRRHWIRYISTSLVPDVEAAIVTAIAAGAKLEGEIKITYGAG